MQEKLPLPVGTTDYKKICRENYYVDKTLLIKDLLDQKTDTILFTRPRRFGKTLNMDMLRTFFEQTAEDTSVYFTDKNIWQQGEKYIQHQGQYPVIYIIKRLEYVFIAAEKNYQGRICQTSGAVKQ